MQINVRNVINIRNLWRSTIFLKYTTCKKSKGIYDESTNLRYLSNLRNRKKIKGI